MNFEEILEKINDNGLKDQLIIHLNVSIKRGLMDVEEYLSELLEGSEEIKKICSENEFWSAFYDAHSDGLKFF